MDTLSDLLMTHDKIGLIVTQNCTVDSSLVNHIPYFHSTGCIASPACGERGSIWELCGRYTVSPAGMSAEPMGLQWSHDIKVCAHKNVMIAKIPTVGTC